VDVWLLWQEEPYVDPELLGVYASRGAAIEVAQALEWCSRTGWTIKVTQEPVLKEEA